MTIDAKWRLALSISVVLNLFLLALVGGHFLRASRSELPAMPVARALARAQATLSPQDAAAFGAVVRRDAPRYVGAWREIVTARRQLEQVLAADPYDKAKAQQAFATWHEAWNQYVDKLGDTLIDGMSQISPEGRRKLIALRRQSHPFRP